jgi:hypothetical protein
MWIELNEKFSESWPNITDRRETNTQNTSVRFRAKAETTRQASSDGERRARFAVTYFLVAREEFGSEGYIAVI